ITPTPQPGEEFPGGLPKPPTGVVVPPEVITPPGTLPPSTGIVVPPDILPGQTPTSPLSLGVSGGIAIADTAVSTPARFTQAAASGSGFVFYDNDTGLFKRFTDEGQIDVMSTRSFRDVKNVAWAPKTDKAVLEFSDGSNIVYDFANNESFTLPSQFEDFSFSPSGDKIAAKDLKINKEDRWLVVVDDEGKNKTLVEHLGENEDRVQVQWNPNNKIIATSAKSIDGNRAEVIFLNENQVMYNKAVIQGRDLKYQYSPSGNKMLYSVYNPNSNYLPTLWITSSDPSAIDSGRIDTGLNTWADKCDFSNEATIYCAVPKEIGKYSGILRSNNESDDDIYAIDTQSGRATLATSLLIPTEISALMVSADGSKIFYVDEDTQEVSSIDINQ
ncbi:hypothetical protein IT409_02495, partial [Candidatus Falkowbacteria bacterium]|nr:hypothetical protein [Candidatus Falkowbacteria bacterium]